MDADTVGTIVEELVAEAKWVPYIQVKHVSGVLGRGIRPGQGCFSVPPAPDIGYSSHRSAPKMVPGQPVVVLSITAAAANA